MQSNNSINNNNNNRSKSSSLSQTPSRMVATPPGSTAHASSQHRTRTPSVERSLSSIKETPDAAKDNGVGRQLPALPNPHILTDQGASALTSLELKHMGRDTIAGLIAGILQKYTKKEGLDSRGNDNKKPEDNHSFVEIALADDEGPADDLTKTTDTDEVTDDSSRPVTALRRTCDSAGAGASSRLSHKSWEAFNHQEEMTQASHTMPRNIVVTERNGETTDNNLDSVERNGETTDNNL